MKKTIPLAIYLFLLVGTFLFSACKQDDLITRSFSTDPFVSITNNISADIHITHDSTQSIEIKAQERIMNFIKLDVNNGMLTIGMKNNPPFNTKPIDIYISIPAISSYILNGSGNMDMVNSFDNCGDVSLQVNGSGNIDAKFNSNTNTSTVINGSGDIDLNGFSPNHSILIDGSGNVNAFPFHTYNTSVNIIGSGNCQVTADSALNVTISGSGNIYYKGNPIINTNISGSGNVINSNK